MKFTANTTALLALLTPLASAATLYLAGDSTMARNTGGVINGWGDSVHNYFSLPVVNLAVGGRSARSYTREGRFADLIKLVKSGDFVVIEFGHNDGGSLTPTDNGRTDCPGTGAETCKTTYNGVAETVKTFNAYLEAAAASLKAKGANVIISSQTPNNPWETGTFTYTPSRFVGYAKLAASRAGVAYVDHGAYTAARWKALGMTAVDKYFPQDHTHTSPAGAVVVAQMFVRGLLCGTASLEKFVANAGQIPAAACV